MQVIRVLDTVGATTAAPTAASQGVTLDAPSEASRGRDEVIVQVDITGTATVRLFGRIDRSLPWAQIGADITASALIPMARVPFLFAQVSARTSGNITVSAGI